MLWLQLYSKPKIIFKRDGWCSIYLCVFGFGAFSLDLYGQCTPSFTDKVETLNCPQGSRVSCLSLSNYATCPIWLLPIHTYIRTSSRYTLEYIVRMIMSWVGVFFFSLSLAVSLSLSLCSLLFGFFARRIYYVCVLAKSMLLHSRYAAIHSIRCHHFYYILSKLFLS